MIVWMLFEDEKIGTDARSQYSTKFPRETNAKWVPITRVVRRFNVQGKKGSKSYHSVSRKQLPLSLACAITMHKTQGKSYDRLELDFKSPITVPGLHYVALSRCRTEDGNYVIGDLHVNQILASTDVKEEMKRLREERQFEFNLKFPHCSFDGTTKIIFHNIQSLRKNIEFVRRSIMYRNCAVIMLCETWLTSNDDSSNYQVDGFQLWRFDYAQQLESRPHAGIVVYVSESVSSVANVSANVLFGVHFSRLTIGR